MNKIYVSLLLMMLPVLLWGQIITVTPAFPTVNDTVTVVYDATQGNAALVGVSPVYAHTGVITNLSTSSSDWKHVQLLPWPTNDPKLLMTSLGNNKFQMKFHIKSFYGITSPTEVVQKLAFVFRNSTGAIVGKDASGGDIFYDVYSGSNINVSVTSPANGTIFSINDPISITANVSTASDLSLYVNNNLVQSATAATTISDNSTATTAGQYWVKVVANNSGTIISDSIYYIVQGTSTIQSPPNGTVFGAQTLSPTSVRLTLNTPFPDKSWVYAIGDFNNWLPTPATQMKKTPDGRIWWVDITGLTAGQEYAFQFLVKNTSGTIIKVADPYTEKVLDPWNDSYIPASIYPNLKPYPVGKTTGIVSVFQTQQTAYNWQVTNFTKPAKTDLVVYELLLRDWSKRHAYQAVIDSLWYLKNLGINAIELMPVMEFEGNSSWGYNPDYMFAPDKYYGTKNKLKELVDKCHQNGIAVILDIVLNHQFGLAPMVNLYWDGVNNKPAANNPWFNPDAKHPYNVGYDMNHNSPETRAWVDSVLHYWVSEYKADGFRFDLSKGFTQTNSGSDVALWGQYDASRIYNIKRMADKIRQVDPNSLLILEHFGSNQEEKELADYGLMPWGKHNSDYNEATMGWIPNSNFQGISWKNRSWNYPHLVGYMESHDEERLMFKNLTYGNSNGSYNVKNLNTALDRMGMAAAFFLTVPGPKMMWQFGELGYDVAKAVPCDLCEKPVLWNYYNVAARNKLYLIHAALAKLRVQEPAFESSDFWLNVSSALKQISITDASMNVNVIGNFGVTSSTGTFTFQNTGKWYDFFSGDSVNITSTTPQLTLNPGEYHLYTSKKLSTPNTNEILADLGKSVIVNAFPNPFSEEVHFVYTLPQSSKVSIRIYNLMGQLIQTLENQKQVNAFEIDETLWDGKDMNGNVSCKGTYFYQIEAMGGVKTGKILKD